MLVPAEVQGALPVTAVMSSSKKHGPPHVRHLSLSFEQTSFVQKKKKKKLVKNFLHLSN